MLHIRLSCMHGALRGLLCCTSGANAADSAAEVPHRRLCKVPCMQNSLGLQHHLKRRTSRVWVGQGCSRHM